MTIREFAIAGVWTASAIGVAQWTWDAYTGQQIPFPGVGNAGGGSDTQDWAGYFTNLPLAIAQDVAKRLEKPISKVIGAAFAPIPKKALKESPAGIAKARKMGVHPGPGR